MICRSVVLEAVSDNVVHFLVFHTLDNTIVVAVVYNLEVVWDNLRVVVVDNQEGGN